MDKIKADVLAFMKENHMADGGDGILAAVSGGADSVCLLFMLHEFAASCGFKLSAFHLNHGLRGEEADRDERFVEELCKRMEVPFYAAREDVAGYADKNGLSEEEAGRILRYRHLNETAQMLGFSRIAVAHHKDDDAETVLFNLFRGSGLRGLSGIRPVRGNIIRPLLCLTRAEIEGYLKEKGLSWCEDSTNGENEYMRNKLRNELLPWVRNNINPRAAEHILKLSAQAAQADAYFEQQAAMLLDGESLRDVSGECGNGRIMVSTGALDAQPEILKTYTVRAMILRAAGQAKDISERHIRAVLSLTGPGGGTTVDLPYGLKAVRGYETLEILRTDTIATQNGCAVEYRIFSWKKGMEIPKNQYTKWFDYDKIKGMLSVRPRKEGDYFLLKGGGTKTVRRYMIDEKIPEAERDSIPLLAEENHILWVIGYRISEYYKVTDMTETILEITICKGENHG